MQSLSSMVAFAILLPLTLLNRFVWMDATTSESDSTDLQSVQPALSTIDGRVWFLGHGLGGCAGLCFFAGLWSLFVDDVFIGWWPLAVSFTHVCVLVTLWARRSTSNAKRATTTCFLIGALGIASTAYFMVSNGSRVPALASLYSLAIMNFVVAFTMPLILQPRRRRSEKEQSRMHLDDLPRSVQA